MKKNFVLIILYAILILVFKTSNAQRDENPISKRIVVVVHMQEDDEADELLIKAKSDVFDRINQIIEESEPENIVYSKIVHKVLNLTLRKIYVEKIDADLDSRLKVVNQNIFTDYNGDIFSSDEFMEFLKGKNVNEIVIVGQAAEGCIKTSTLKGLKLGYDMYLVPEAIIGNTEKSKEKAIKKLIEKGANEISF